MIKLISLQYTVAQTRMGFFYFHFQNIYLMSLECTLAQTRMGFGRVTLPVKGPMRGQYVFLVAKSQFF